jgi:5-(carboxyamino)imidazole ribonucleotide synthase
MRYMINSDFLAVNKPICIGIIGGGQLGKMIAHEARRMSLKIIILDPTEDCPASRIADQQIIADFKDESAIMRLANECDVVTYEIELANSSALKTLELKGYPIRPSPETLHVIQNKYRQKVFLSKNNIPVPRFELINSEIDLPSLCDQFGFPVMLKACEDSYDGRGNYLVHNAGQLPEALNYFSGRQCMLEKFIPFAKEISIMVARNPSGQIESFPVAENIHKNNILHTTIVPARINSQLDLQAKRVAEKTMAALHGAGIFGIEMFVSKEGEILVNEVAPRPHNSGHYTNEACSISQFEQHIRAILDLPLGKPELLSPAVMVNILGNENFRGPYAIKGLREMLRIPGVKLYVYGKKIAAPRRKLGHITAVGKTVDEAIERANEASKMIELVPRDEVILD